MCPHHLYNQKITRHFKTNKVTVPKPRGLQMISCQGRVDSQSGQGPDAPGHQPHKGCDLGDQFHRPSGRLPGDSASSYNPVNSQSPSTLRLCETASIRKGSFNWPRTPQSPKADTTNSSVRPFPRAVPSTVPSTAPPPNRPGSACQL